MFYIYILHSESSDVYYTGHSDDPHRRLTEHNTNPHDTYTSKHRPWKLIAIFEAGQTRSEAFTIERWIKKQKSRKLLEHITTTTDPLTGPLAQLVRVPPMRD